MKLSLSCVNMDGRVAVYLDRLIKAEQLGFDKAWSAEAYGGDAVSTAAWMLAHTTRIRVGTCIMQMPARAPAMAAMTAQSLDHLSGSRFILGLGPSGPQVVEGWYGVPYGKPMTRTREYIGIVRQVLARKGPLEHHGEHYDIPNTGAGTTGLGKPLKSMIRGNPAIPIFTAAMSPAGIRLAGEIADGVLPLWMSPEKFHLVSDHVKQGQAKAGRDGTSFEIIPGVTTVLVEDNDQLEKAKMPARATLALYIGGMGARDKNFYNDYCKRLGYEEAAVRIQDAFLSGDREGAVAAVPDALVDELFLIGSEDYLRDRLQLWKEARDRGGVTGMLVTSSQPRVLEFLAEELL